MKYLKNSIFIIFLFLISCMRSFSGDIEYKIVSLFNDKEYTGSFVLATGSIGNNEYYNVFIENNDKSFYKVKLPARITLIIENDNDIKIKVEYSFKTLESDCENNSCLNPDRIIRAADKIYLYVPRNTIIREIKLK